MKTQAAFDGEIKPLSFVICSNRSNGTLRKALACVAAQPEHRLWDCVLVDNGFDVNERTALLDEAKVLFSAGNFKCVREPIPGLGYARKTGFAHASGEWIVMLDDDNYVAPDLVPELSCLLRRFPETGGVVPLVYPVFHGEPTSWKIMVANRCLSVNEGTFASTSGLPKYYEALMARDVPRPPGGGMIIRREVAEKWAEDAGRKGLLFLGRTGVKPIGAEDEQIWRTLLSRHLSVVVADKLRIAHDLPNERFGWSYLWNLNYWMAWSYAWLNCSDGLSDSSMVARLSVVENLRHLKLLWLAVDKEERMTRWMDWAGSRGRAAGMRSVAKGLQSLPKTESARQCKQA